MPPAKQKQPLIPDRAASRLFDILLLAPCSSRRSPLPFADDPPFVALASILVKETPGRKWSYASLGAILTRIKYVDLQKCYPVKLGEALPWCCIPRFLLLQRRTNAWRSFAQVGEGSTKFPLPRRGALDAGSLGLRSPVRLNSAVLVRSLHVSLTYQRAFRLLERQPLSARLPSLACVWAWPWQPFASQPWLPYVACRV